MSNPELSIDGDLVYCSIEQLDENAKIMKKGIRNDATVAMHYISGTRRHTTRHEAHGWLASLLTPDETELQECVACGETRAECNSKLRKKVGRVACYVQMHTKTLERKPARGLNVVWLATHRFI